MIKSYSHFLEAADRSKNTHMIHIEDLVLYGGVNGAREAITALSSLHKMLAGSTSSPMDVTTKWDGAPAVFAGIDPTDGKFFVAKKGIFNKDPKVYKTAADVKADTTGDLQTKLLIALKEFPKLGIKGILQGDLMFTSDTVKKETIDGEPNYTFHPNTIVYAVPVDSDLGAQIKRAKVGVVWHTAYYGSSFDKLKASFGPNVDYLKKIPSVWSHSATLRDVSGTATMTKKKSQKVAEALSTAGKIFSKISSSVLKQIEANQSFAQTLETYNNSLIRNNKRIGDTTKHVEGLIAWAEAKHKKDIDSKKSERGKKSSTDKRDQYMSFFSDDNKKNLALIYDLQKSLVVAKELIIKQLEVTASMGTFIKKKNGFEVTGHEGFVAIDHVKGAVKLVDRLQFSYANFSPEVIKGWDH